MCNYVKARVRMDTLHIARVAEKTGRCVWVGNARVLIHPCVAMVAIIPIEWHCAVYPSSVVAEYISSTKTCSPLTGFRVLRSSAVTLADAPPCFPSPRFIVRESVSFVQNEWFAKPPCAKLFGQARYVVGIISSRGRYPQKRADLQEQKSMEPNRTARGVEYLVIPAHAVLKV